MEILYEKLVRDKIPEIIKHQNKKCKTSILNEETYFEALNKKLEEELNEYLESGEIEELADILEVIYAILEFKETNPEELEIIRKNKMNKRGGFKDKIWLHSVTE